jgi:hypothetical protein
LELPENVTVTPARGSGPKVKTPSDIDPREFLLDIDELRQISNTVIKVKVKYFACNDDEGWCKPVNQTFLVTLEADRDAGSVRQRGGRGGRGGFAGGQRPGAGGRGGRPPMGNGPRVMGTIEKVDLKERLVVTVDRSAGGKKTVHVPAGVSIFRNGQAAKLSDLKPQDRVMLMLTEAPGSNDKDEKPGSKAITAKQVMARSGGFQPPGRRPPR